MSLMEHLYELRRRLFFAVLGIFVGTVVGFIWFGHGIPAIGLPSLSDILTGPYCAVPATERLALGDGDGCKLLATGPFSALELQLKSALIAGHGAVLAGLALPAWAFVTPALYSKERRYAITFVSCGGLLFVHRRGAGLRGDPGGPDRAARLRRRRDHRGAVAGQLFLVPDRHADHLRGVLRAAAAADHAEPDRMVSSAKLAKWRRYSIFGMVVFAGLVVPGNDPITMLALAIALILLYELSVQVTRIHDRRAAKRERSPNWPTTRRPRCRTWSPSPGADLDHAGAAGGGRRAHPGAGTRSPAGPRRPVTPTWRRAPTTSATSPDRPGRVPFCDACPIARS